MPVEFIGMISTSDQSEVRVHGGPVTGKDCAGKGEPLAESAGAAA